MVRQGQGVLANQRSDRLMKLITAHNMTGSWIPVFFLAAFRSWSFRATYFYYRGPTDVPSAVEVFTTLRYISLHLLTYLLAYYSLCEIYSERWNICRSLKYHTFEPKVCLKTGIPYGMWQMLPM